MKYQIICKVRDKKISNSRLVRQTIESFEGKIIRITIEKCSKKRSNPQNRYYWGVCVPLIQQALKDLGNIFDKEQVHDLLKFKFLKEEIPIGNDGEFIVRIKSSTELTTSAFMDFKAEIQQWAAEFLGIQIPDPAEQVNMEFD